jgi:DNA ligase (NAD+)
MTPTEKTALYLKAKAGYYHGTPIMSDAQFDALENEIREANPDAEELKLVGAPLPAKAGSRAKHLIPMGSQEKVNTYEELVRWESLRAKDPSALFHLSQKVDGGSLALYYRKGCLVQAVTRGDGLEGEDITFQAPLFQGVPSGLALPISIGVRCEAYCTLEDWKKADPSLESNPRNVANGILGRKDSLKARFVSIAAFDLENLEDWEELHLAKTETEKYLILQKLGFATAPWKGNLTLAEAKAAFEQIAAERASLPFWIDGTVVRYESIAVQKSLGSTDGRPKGQVAWKFPAESGWTRCEAVEDQVGHSGAVTPVAIVEALRLGGTTVRRASLSNYDNVRALGVKIGSRVLVAKAGDIIPEIIKAEGEGEEIAVPTKCPVCESTLARRKNVDGSDSVVLFCENPDCTAQTAGKIRRFCKSRDILGLGDSIIAGLLGDMAIQDISDLPGLTPEAIENVTINDKKGIVLGRKRAESICAEIKEKTASMTLAEFLGAFGTRGLGVRRATLMIEANPELGDIERWFDESLANPEFAQKAGVPQLGAIIAADLKNYEGTIRKMLTTTRIIAKEAPAQKAEGGLTICITGSLPSGKKKKDYAGPLAAAGHRLVDDLTKEVNALVMADPNGPESSKTKKAKKMGIELHDEAWLQKLCG